MAFLSLLRCIQSRLSVKKGLQFPNAYYLASLYIPMHWCLSPLSSTLVDASVSIPLTFSHPPSWVTREIWNWFWNGRDSVFRLKCMILHIWFRKYWQMPDLHIFNDSRLMLINWFWVINRAGCDQSSRNRDSFEHFPDLQWQSTFRAPASPLHTMTIFVSISSWSVFLSARSWLVTYMLVFGGLTLVLVFGAQVEI